MTPLLTLERRTRLRWAAATIAAVLTMASCGNAPIRRVETLPNAPLPSLWRAPDDLESRDLYHGPWGAGRAPDPHAIYTFVRGKHSGVNPGMTVRDSLGRRWSVKQPPPGGWPPEGPIEVVLSRVLSAVGYHQPPAYYLGSFLLEDDWGTRVEPGGRFRPQEEALKDRGQWSWQQNPFVGTRPYQGLLVILLVFGGSDFKNSNNTLYEYRPDGPREHWYVVRDLGMALGETGRLAPRRGDPDVFARQRFILGVRNGFVRFDYRGWHQELVGDRITPEEVRWACELLARLSDRQWHDAFRAGGYTPALAGRFIRQIQLNIALGRRIGETRLAASEER
jgi:hypothetical protein